MRCLYRHCLSAKNLFEDLKHVDDAKPFINLLTYLLTLGLIQNTKEGFQAERTLKALEDKNSAKNYTSLSKEKSIFHSVEFFSNGKII